MNLARIAAYLTAALALSLAFLAYVNYIDVLGFPDGFISELGYAQRRLVYIFIGLSVFLSIVFIYLGTVAFQKQSPRKIVFAVILYLIIVVGIVFVDYYYRLTLTGSGGA